MADAETLIQQLQLLLNPGTIKPINWQILKILCPTQLDLIGATKASHKSWSAGFNGFIRETSLKNHGWETQMVALQAVTTESTYTVIDAMRLRMPKQERESMDKVLDMIETLIEGSTSPWVKRQEFHSLRQKPGETARQFYSHAVAPARECDFENGFCSVCSMKVVEEHLISKLVFACSSDTARRQLIKKKQLSLQQAKEIIEAQELLRETAESLQEVLPQVNAVCDNGVRSQQQYKKRGDYSDRRDHRSDRRDNRADRRDHHQQDNRQEQCQKCGFVKHSGPECPAMGSSCRNCGGQNHWSKVCRKPPSSQASTGRMGHIICAMSTVTERVDILCEGNSHSAIIDTGSDWCCTSRDHLNSNFREVVENLIPPTGAMLATRNASGQCMQPLGFFPTSIHFGERKTEVDMVVFGDVSDTYLSKTALVELGVVVINKHPPLVSKVSKPKLKSSVPVKEDRFVENQRDYSHQYRDGRPPIPPRLGVPFQINGKPKPRANEGRSSV